MTERTDIPTEPRLNWPARGVRWCQTTIDGIARELVSKHLASQKDMLLSTTCGGSFFEQLVQEFHRLDHYPTTVPLTPVVADVPPPGAPPGAPADQPAPVSPPVADTPAISPATEEYKTMVRAAFAEAAEKYRAGRATWDDYHALRKLLLPLYPRDELYGVLITLRKAFEDQATKKQMDAYEGMGPDAVGPGTSHAQVLVHALYLQEQVAKLETYRPHQELKRSYITFALFVSLTVTVSVEAIGSWGVLRYYSQRDSTPEEGASAQPKGVPAPGSGAAQDPAPKKAVQSFSPTLSSFVTLVDDVSIPDSQPARDPIPKKTVQPFTPNPFPFVTLVMFLGALGATVSYQRRLQQSFDEDGSILNTTRYVGTGIGVKVTPFQGSVFAFVLLCICYSNLLNDLTTGVLPKRVDVNETETIGGSNKSVTVGGSNKTVAVGGSNTPTQTNESKPAASTTPDKMAEDDILTYRAQWRRMIARLFLVGPCDGVEFAKLLVFSFLAGFAERLVPDTLDRLTMTTRKAKS